MDIDKESEKLINKDFYSIFSQYNAQAKKLSEKADKFSQIFGAWGCITFVLPVMGFYVGGRIAVILMITSLLLLISTSMLIQKTIERKKAKLEKNDYLINLLYSETFHKSLFPYLNSLVEKYPQYFTLEITQSENTITIDKTQKLKTLLINDHSLENFNKIKGEFELIENLLKDIEKEQELYDYEKQIGVEILLPSLLDKEKSSIVRNELVKML